MTVVRGVPGLRAVAVGLLVAAGAGGVLWWRWQSAPTGGSSIVVHGEPRAYSARVVRTDRDSAGTRESTELVARSGVRSRSEWTEAGVRMALITRPDLGVAWLVDLSRATYVVVPQVETAPTALTGESIEELVGSDGRVAEATVQSSEDVRLDGHPCRLVRTAIRGREGGVTNSAVWSALDLDGLVVRSELVDSDGSTSTIELRDLSLDPGNDLFELPPGVAEVANGQP